MIRSALSAFAVVAVCFAIMQVPGQHESLPMPSASATPPATILPIPDSDELWLAVHSLEDRVEALEIRPECPCPAVSVVEPVKAEPVVAQSQSFTYVPRWSSNDGRTLRQHAIEVHGIDPGLSDAEMARQHDAYHDRFGGMPPRILPTASRARTVTVQSPYVSSCPGGVCPVNRMTTVQSSGGVFGFGILGRRR
jgi:hypothetical protein